MITLLCIVFAFIVGLIIGIYKDEIILRCQLIYEPIACLFDVIVESRKHKRELLRGEIEISENLTESGASKARPVDPNTKNPFVDIHFSYSGKEIEELNKLLENYKPDLNKHIFDVIRDYTKPLQRQYTINKLT